MELNETSFFLFPERAIILPLVDCVILLVCAFTFHMDRNFKWIQWLWLVSFTFCIFICVRLFGIITTWILLQAEKIWWRKREGGQSWIFCSWWIGGLTLGGVRMLSTLSYCTSLPCSLSLFDQIWLSRKLSLCFQCPQSFYSDDSLIPCFSAFCLGYWCLQQSIFMIFVHEPWCVCLTSSLCFFLLCLLGFRRLWRQRQHLL